MANPSKIIINIKGVSAEAWDKARAAAQRNDETMGSWISRAIVQLADLEAGRPRELPPDPPKPAGIAPGDLAAIMHAAAELTAATGVKPLRRDVARLHALHGQLTRAALGMPPKAIPAGKAPGQTRTLEG